MATLDVLHGNEFFGIFVSHKPSHPKIPRSYVLHKLILLHFLSFFEFFFFGVYVVYVCVCVCINMGIKEEEEEESLKNWGEEKQSDL